MYEKQRVVSRSTAEKLSVYYQGNVDGFTIACEQAHLRENWGKEKTRRGEGGEGEKGK